MAELTIGILALQGAFAEHQTRLRSLTLTQKIVTLQVRAVEELSRCDALIIPGGESTTIALLARLAGLLEPLREFVKRKPVWGTCAGAILLSQKVEGAKNGGQELLEGISVTIARNGWGSQVESFEADLLLEGLEDSDRPFSGVFIRAPVVLSLDHNPQLPDHEILARLPVGLLPPSQRLVSPDEDDTDPRAAQTIVALRQGNHLLTTFHPELTADGRFHDYFIRQCVVPSLQ